MLDEALALWRGRAYAEFADDDFARPEVARLEELALALERSGASSRSAGRLLESASVATINAIELNLLSEEAANEIWGGVARRHPELPLRRAA